MDKQHLLELVNSLPDNLEVLPISLTDTSSHKVDGPTFAGLTGTTYRAEYEDQYEHILTLSFRFKTKVKYEFQRDDDGNPQVTNVRRIP